MTDNNDIPSGVTSRVAIMERDLEELNRLVTGELPVEAGTESVVGRLELIDRSLVALSIASGGQAVQGGLAIEDETLALADIEWGKPSSSPTGESATITVQPCEEDGTSYASADTAKLYIRNDRSVLDLDDKGWDTDTILSFIRFPWDTTTDSAVGVLVGEGKGHIGDGTPDSGGGFTKHYIGVFNQADTTAAFYTLANCLNSLLFVGLDVRETNCLTTVPYQNTLMAGGQFGVAWGNPISTWAGDASNWMSLIYCYVDQLGATTHGIGAFSGVDLQARVTAAGVLEFRVDCPADLGDVDFVVMGAIWRKTCDDPPGTEFGAGS